MADSAMIQGAGLLVLLLVACAYDIRSRRIPNWLVVVILASGVVAAALTGGLGAVGGALISAGLGLALWLPLYSIRWLGAGDVKLFAAASAWLPVSSVVNAALLSAFAGGGLSLLWIIRVHGLTTLATRFAASGARNPLAAATGAVLGLPQEAPDAATRRKQVPYGIALTVGLMLAWAGFSVVRF